MPLYTGKRKRLRLVYWSFTVNPFLHLIILFFFTKIIN